MKSLALWALIAAALYALAALIGKDKPKRRRQQRLEPTPTPAPERKLSAPAGIKRKDLWQPSELAMFRRLSEALPDHIVLSEVGYQAFLSAGGDMSLQGRIKSRRVDFLIVDQGGGIVAAIEVDGTSHDQDEAAADDHFKNQLFAAAGVRLVRWRAEAIPKGPEIRERVFGASA